MAEKPKRPHPLTILLLPEVALGYVLAGIMIMIAGYEWGWLVMGAGMVVMFSFDAIEERLSPPSD